MVIPKALACAVVAGLAVEVRLYTALAALLVGGLLLLARLLRRDPDGTVHEASRKMFILRGTATQGAAKRSVDVGSAMEARRVGDVAAFSAPNARARPEGTESYEICEFWVRPQGSQVQSSTTLTLTLIN